MQMTETDLIRKLFFCVFCFDIGNCKSLLQARQYQLHQNGGFPKVTGGDRLDGRFLFHADSCGCTWWCNTWEPTPMTESAKSGWKCGACYTCKYPPAKPPPPPPIVITPPAPPPPPVIIVSPPAPPPAQVIVVSPPAPPAPPIIVYPQTGYPGPYPGYPYPPGGGYPYPYPPGGYPYPYPPGGYPYPHPQPGGYPYPHGGFPPGNGIPPCCNWNGEKWDCVSTPGCGPPAKDNIDTNIITPPKLQGKSSKPRLFKLDK